MIARRSLAFADIGALPSGLPVLWEPFGEVAEPRAGCQSGRCGDGFTGCIPGYEPA